MDLPERKGLVPLREILERALLCYLDVRHDGLVLQGERKPVNIALARIYDFGGARTLYRQRRPVCRSLDGVTAIHASITPSRQCADCKFRQVCTPQVRVDLRIASQSYRGLLAFSSARNFLVYEARLRQEQLAIDRVDTQITVVDHGSWGELRFQRVDRPQA